MTNNLYINSLGLKPSSLTKEIERETIYLYDHPLYSAIKSTEQIRTYMHSQVWCVWDFMTLVKSIQFKLIPPNILWQPPKYPTLGAYIYEVLLTEETDNSIRNGENASHFQTYIEAMKESKVDTAAIEKFIQLISKGKSFDYSINKCGIHKEAREFVENTFQFANADLHISTSVFCLSREGVIPGMFNSLLSNLSLGKDFKILNWYLNRHIYLDSESHGPLSIKLFKTVVDNKKKEKEALEAALSALKARNKFMTSIFNKLK